MNNNNLEKFREKYPIQKMTLSSGKSFAYRYYKNQNAKAAIVLLTGGIGLSDLFYLHFEKFAKKFSVLTFDYQIQFADNSEFAQAVAELLKKLGEKAWLVGQSLGGIVAQIIAKKYPEAVDGMVLSNTCSLAKDMGSEAYEHLQKMIDSQKKSKKMLKFVPFSLYKKLIKFAVMKKKTDSFTENEKKLMENLCDAMLKLLTKEYEYHMIDFLVDAENHFGMKPEDFTQFNDRVLLILSEDDNTFNQACKASLISIMTNPTVVTDITGGHLALLVKLEKYAETVSDYIIKRV
ncbi:MAG: alpha/beta hydrolase [Ruminococcus sp.]|nr:alpha/beta hydrolase [Ruminococcus sp.]